MSIAEKLLNLFSTVAASVAAAAAAELEIHLLESSESHRLFRVEEDQSILYEIDSSDQSFDSIEDYKKELKDNNLL